MLKITTRQKIAKSAVIMALESQLAPLYYAKCAMIANMSGHPSALHSIGRLQRSIKLTSFKDLLNSLKRLDDLAYTTAEVIGSMDGTKVDRYQINRTEIIAYVQNITSSMNNFVPTDEDTDMIAHLITSFEANPSAWILSGESPTSSFHILFQKLYHEVLIGTPGADLAVYAAHTDSIVTYGSLPQVEALRRSQVKKRKDKNEEQSDFKQSDDQNEEIVSMYTTYRLACVRLIDHVYQLLMDKDIWYDFVAPRTKADVMTNLERAKSLKVFALYLQSLLVYHQFFAIEMFMKSYDLVQDWIAHFPKLEEPTLNRLENTIRTHDYLNAREDVNELITSFGASAKEDLDSVAFPREFLPSFGLVATVKKLEETAGEYALASDLTNLKELDNPKYLPLISGIAASTFNVAYEVASLILVGKQVSEQVDKALTGLVPSMVRGSGKATTEGLQSLNIKCKLEFRLPVAATWQIGAGVPKQVSDGVLKLDSASPMFSFDYHEYIRQHFRLSLLTDRQVSQAYPYFSASQVVDLDKARELREILAYQWRSLIPSTWGEGDRTFSFDHFIGSPDNVRSLIEVMSGINYDVAVKQMSLPHLREIWATFFSSFAIMYFNQSEMMTRIEDAFTTRKDINLTAIRMVEGHGKPYGTTYASLAQFQGQLTEKTNILPIGGGVYLQLLNQIPIAQDDLRMDPTPFYAEHPVFYFQSNSVTEPVKDWVIGDGLQNFSLIPVLQTPVVPQVRFSPKYTFLTQNLYLQIDLFYRPVQADKPRENYRVGLTTSDWPFDRHQYFLEYKHWGPYATPSAEIKVPEEQEQIADAVKKIEQTITEQNKQAAEITVAAGTATKEAAVLVEKEVDKLNDRVSGKNIDDDAEPVVI